jgi:hypothetical protein
MRGPHREEGIIDLGTPVRKFLTEAKSYALQSGRGGGGGNSVLA